MEHEETVPEMPKCKVAIIGSDIGASVLTCLLAQKHDVTLYEPNSQIGGNDRTIEIFDQGQMIPIETNIMLFNKEGHPNLFGFFNTLGLEHDSTQVSLSLNADRGWLEYNTDRLFAQKRNMIRPAFWNLLSDLLRFNNEAHRYNEAEAEMIMEECSDRLLVHEWFRKYYLFPLITAIWHCSHYEASLMPARIVVGALDKFGLLTEKKPRQWRTLTGGSKSYITRIHHLLGNRIKLNQDIKTVTLHENQWTVITNDGEPELYDHIIMACDTDEALRLLEKKSTLVEEFLSAFTYKTNMVVTHTDTKVMPKNIKCWGSANYTSKMRGDYKDRPSVTYWINKIQNLKTDTPIFVSLNPEVAPKESLIIDQYERRSLLFDIKAAKAQNDFHKIQGQNNLWFSGAYRRFGLAEDSLWSAARVARGFDVDIPWEKK